MIKVICDMCGEELNTFRVDVEFTYEAGYLLSDAFHREKHLCTACTNRLFDWMNEQLKKEGEDSAGD